MPVDLVDTLTAAGHDTDTVPSEQLTGKPGADIFAAAVREGRLLITQDLDFSDARRFAPGTHPGVLLIRLYAPTRRNLIARVAQLIETEPLESLAGCLAVLTDHKLRVRKP